MGEAREVDASAPQPGVWVFSPVPALPGRSLSVFHPVAIPSTLLVQVQAGNTLGTKRHRQFGTFWKRKAPVSHV